MKFPRVIVMQYEVVACLFIFLNLCHGQVQTNGSVIGVKQKDTSSDYFDLLPSSNSLDLYIRSIYQDRKGNYWFGTNGAGVYHYDQRTLTQFTTKDGLADDQVIHIQEDRFGNLWFGSGNFKISKYDGVQFISYNHDFKMTKGTKHDWGSKDNDLWFFSGGGVFRFQNSSMDYLPLESSDSIGGTHVPFDLSRYAVYAILKDTKGNMWFGTQAEGVCRYDGDTLTWFKEKGLGGPTVLCLFEDSKGKLWIGNNGSGVFYYDGNSLINFTEKMGLSNPDFRVSGKSRPETMARVYAINEDKNGNIWIGTVDAGVWKYDGIGLSHYTTEHGLTSNAVNTIFKDQAGDLWFGTDSNGICIFDGIEFKAFIIK
jgi:ligand-binding sensor domain-containing protein